jgi:hypothetical protein
MAPPTVLVATVAMFMVVEYAPAANALVCARGVHRAECVTSRGTSVSVRRPGVTCRWIRGARVCRSRW